MQQEAQQKGDRHHRHIGETSKVRGGIPDDNQQQQEGCDFQAVAQSPKVVKGLYGKLQGRSDGEWCSATLHAGFVGWSAGGLL